jgi:hypothetical protein
MKVYQHTFSALLAVALAVNLAFVPALMAQQREVVPRATTLRLILNDSLHTDENEVGDRFRATLADDVRVEGSTLIRQGALVEGTITQLEEAKRLAGLRGQAKMTLRFDRIHVDGRSYPITATLVSVHDPVEGLTDEDVRESRDDDDDVDIGDEGEVEAEDDITGIITRGAIGVGAGALLGALFGNVSRGVLLGSIGGAVAILAPKGKDVDLREGTGLQVRLDRDLNLRIT